MGVVNIGFLLQNNNGKVIMKKFFVLLFVISLFYGCSKPIVEGEVKDISGQPLQGVSVKIKNTRLQTSTDEQGRYAIKYSLGAFTVLYTKDGYLDYEMHLNISSKDKIPAELITLSALTELFIKKKPENAEIKISKIDNQGKMVQMDYFQGKLLKPGCYQIHAICDGYISQIKQIQIETDELKEIEIFLEPISPVVDQESVKGRFLYGKNEMSEFFIISGILKNKTKKSYNGIKVKGVLYNKKKEAVKSQIVNCGNVLADNEIENMKFDEIQKYLSTKTKLHALEIPYMIIFSNLPKNLSNFTVSLADVD
jgi:hypothetical protein